MSPKHIIIVGLFLFLCTIGIDTTIYWFLFLLTFIFGFITHLILNKKLCDKSNSFYNRIKFSYFQAKIKSHFIDNIFDTTLRSKNTNQRASLTGTSDIDEPLYELIDLFVRDYVEIWYKTKISSDESFIDEVKNGIYTTIRHIAERVHEIDWLDFCTGTIVDSFATHVRLYRNAKERMRLEQSKDICSCYFDLEAEYERGICRDDVCMNSDKEKEFLRDMVDVLLYILLPANEFRCVPARTIVREIAVNLALIPFIDMYSDPDAINQLIIKMCQQIPLTIDNFLLVVRTNHSKTELSALIERLNVEQTRWRSRDTGGENDAEIRATLNSYQYLRKLLDERLSKQNEPGSTTPDDYDDALTKVSYRDVPLTEILNNGHGLDYFLKFLDPLDASGYVNFYLNAEAFRCFAVNLLQHIADKLSGQDDINMLRETAKGFIEQYFPQTGPGSFKLRIDENLVNKTLDTINNGLIDETILDELQNKVFEILSSDKYYGQFKASQHYLKFLGEIEFTDTIIDNSDSVSLSSNNSNEFVNDSTELSGQQSSPGASTGSTSACVPDVLDSIENYSITTEINQSGVCRDKGDTYAIYVISVSCKPLNSNAIEQRREWITYRRFSEFNDFHMTIKKRFPALKEFVNLPTKNFINNTSEDVRIKRQKELNDYLIKLCKPRVLQMYPGLGDLLLKFLRNQLWISEQTGLARKDIFNLTMDTLANPFKQASKGIVKGVSKIGGGLTIVSDSVLENAGKLFRSNTNSSMNLARNLQTFSIVEETQFENAKNIPLRVLLVIMDEVFDLKQKNMWFRSSFVSILKRFVRTFMGDSVNRRIVTFVQHWTSAKKIAKEITRFKESFWPNGVLGDKPPERDQCIRNVTQVLCKAKLLGIVSDELRHIIGSETTRHGLLRLFELLQNKTLNRRFVYIVFEALMIKLFRPNDLQFILEKLYSQSQRVKEEYRRPIFEQGHYHNGIVVNQPHYISRLSVRTDDNNILQQSNNFQQPKSLPRSLSKISR